MGVRVLVVGHSAAPSGAELALVRQLGRLRRFDVDVQLCLGEQGAIAGMARDAGCRVHVLDIPRALLARRRNDIRPLRDAALYAPALFHAAAQVARIARSERIDVVSAFSMKAFAYGSLGARLARVPLMWQLHDIPRPPYFSRRSQRLFEIMLHASRPRLIVVPSQAVAKTVRGFATVVVPHGVERHALDPLPRRAVTGRSSRRRAVFRVGMPARIAEWKGQHIVIEAVAALRGRGVTDVELVIAGAPWFGEERYLQRLQRLVDARGLDGAVRFVGHIDDVPGFLDDVDAVSHASTAPEPFGIAIIEALAAGRPVVAADAGAIGEILGGCEAGLLVPPGDPQRLASALETLATESTAQRLRRREAALARARRYDARLEAARLARCYRAVAAGKLPELS